MKFNKLIISTAAIITAQEVSVGASFRTPTQNR